MSYSKASSGSVDGAGGPALPKCFTPPRAATPGTLQTLPGTEREASLLPSKPFNWKKRKKKISNNKYQSKGFLPFEGQEGEQPGEGWTCPELSKLSRDPDPAGLEDGALS